jgi:glycosyltransferase involved in cell wall biosynthesis
LSTNQLGRRKAEIAYASRGRLIAKHVARPWHPFALAFTALLSPLVNGARPLDLLRISRAVARGYRSAGNAETFSKREPRPQTRATIGILANIFEPGAGILAGGHLHFIEVVKRWRNVNLVVFAPEIARADIGAALPQATFVPLPSPNYLHRAKALMFLYRSFAAIKQLRALRRCDAFLATSHLLPDVLPPIVARRPTAVVVHHLITSKRDEASALALTSALGERLSLALIRLGARTLVAGSPMMLRELRARGFDLPAVVTTNGVDHLRFPVVNLDGASRSGAVFVGRLHPAKNPADAIRAWAIVAAKFPNEKLTIIGKAEISDYALELQNLVSELGLAERVDFAGAVSDAEKLTALIRARVFLFPSREEGWGIAVAEAMRAGLPCVTYDLPIFREIFPQGRLAAKMHDYEALARQVVSLLSDEPLRIHYAREAAQLAETFTWANASQVEAAAVAGMLPAQCETIASHA